MFIAHLPASYIITRILQDKFNNHKYLWIGLMGSVVPDLDLLYFYLVSKRKVAHHEYWSHFPSFWLAIAMLTFSLIKIFKKNYWQFPVILFFVGIFSHLVLDSIAAPIHWLAPFSGQDFQLINVPAVYNWWVLNFVLHWTFLLELLICFAAGYLFFNELTRSKNGV